MTEGEKAIAMQEEYILLQNKCLGARVYIQHTSVLTDNENIYMDIFIWRIRGIERKKEKIICKFETYDRLLRLH